MVGFLDAKWYVTSLAITCHRLTFQDNTDAQYGGFRQNIPYLFIVVVLHPILRKAYDSFWRADTYTQVRSSSAIGGLTMGLTPSAAADARMNQRVSFDLLFAAVFLAALHGFSAFKILAILYANYCIGTKLPRQYVPAATWIFNVGTLFANEFSDGYSYANILGVFLPSTVSEKGEPTSNFGHTLDSYGGLIPRWEVLFNFTILRLISFNLDYYWSLNTRTSSPLEVLYPPYLSSIWLITSRRNNSTLPISPSGTESLYPLNLLIIRSATTSPMPCTRLSTSLGPSLLSMTTSLNADTNLTASLPSEPPSTLFVSLLSCSPWKS
jgi:hypothetical protein